MKRALLSALLLAAGAAAPVSAQLHVDEREDLAKPVKMKSGQGAILVAFRRPDEMSMGKSGAFAFARYDVEARDLVYQPRDAKKKGDTTTYSVRVKSEDRKSPLEYHLMLVSAGDYVLAGATPGPAKQVINTFCLGAPTFRVEAGEVVYFGDITPYTSVRLKSGEKVPAMAWSSDPEAARRALEDQPALAAAFRPAEIRNDATYACIGQEMIAYAVPGAEALAAQPAVEDEAASRSEIASPD